MIKAHMCRDKNKPFKPHTTKTNSKYVKEIKTYVIKLATRLGHPPEAWGRRSHILDDVGSWPVAPAVRVDSSDQDREPNDGPYIYIIKTNNNNDILNEGRSRNHNLWFLVPFSPRLQVLSNFQMLVHVLFPFMLVLALVLVLVLMLVLVQALELLRHSGIVTGTGHSRWWSWWR